MGKVSQWVAAVSLMAILNETRCAPEQYVIHKLASLGRFASHRGD
jgi:hypothetical protein